MTWRGRARHEPGHPRDDQPATADASLLTVDPCDCSAGWPAAYECLRRWVRCSARPRWPGVPVDDDGWARSAADHACWPDLGGPVCVVCARATAGPDQWCARCRLVLVELAGEGRRVA